MSDPKLRWRWCDGFVPERYYLDDPVPRITGSAWIVDGQKQEYWSFTLFLDHVIVSRADIAWETLIPPEDMTRWIALDISRKLIQIEPTAAVPDRT